MATQSSAFTAFAGCVLLALVMVPGVSGSVERTVKAGDTYRSPKKLFTITVPEVCSPFPLRYSVGETGKKADKGGSEEAWFYVHDMGELYRVGIFALTPELRALVKTPEGPLSPPALSWLGLRTHLGNREKRTGRWTPASKFETVQTTYGPSVLAVTHVEGGRFLEGYTTTKEGMVRLPPAPAVVVTLVAQHGEDVLFVTAQADATVRSQKGEELPEPVCLLREVRKLMEGMVIAPRALDVR